MQPQFNFSPPPHTTADPEFLPWLTRMSKKIAAGMRGPVAPDAVDSGAARTVSVHQAHLTSITLTDDTTLTLAVNTRRGAHGYLELTQDATGSRAVTWVNATGPGGAIDAPTATAEKRTLYFCLYLGGDEWILSLVADDY